MGDEYLIDGYNLLHALGLPPGPLGARVLEKARDRLLDRLVAAFKDNDAAITVVFDARQPPRGSTPEQVYRGVRVVFAVKHAEADALLEDMIRAHGNPRRLRIVSDDRRVQRAARRRRAQILSCGAFMDELQLGMKEVKQRDSPDPDAKGDQSDADRQHWTREFGDIGQDPSLKELFDCFEDNPATDDNA